MKPSKALLTEDEIVKSVPDIVAASDQLNENAMVLDKGRNMELQFRGLGPCVQPGLRSL